MVVGNSGLLVTPVLLHVESGIGESCHWWGRQVVWQSSRSTLYNFPWWRHQMETFSALLAICAGNSPVPGEFPAQRPVTRSFDVFFDLHPNKRLSKQWWGWWFGTLSCPLWRHRNASHKWNSHKWNSFCIDFILYSLWSNFSHWQIYRYLFDNSGEASNETFVKMIIFPFQCLWSCYT